MINIRKSCVSFQLYCVSLILSAVGFVLVLFGLSLAVPSPSATARVSLSNSQHLLAPKVHGPVVAGSVPTGGYIQGALSEAQREHEMVKAEQEAFQQFAREVESMGLRTQTYDRPRAVGLLDSGGNTDDLQEVRRRYNETVRSVPDYARAYDETLREHLHEEFGQDIASVVTQGGQLTPQLKQLLVRQARRSATQRELLADDITTEIDSLHNFRSDIRDIEETLGPTAEKPVLGQPFDGLVAQERNLAGAKRRYERLLQRRQDQIHRQTDTSEETDPALQEYLYSALDVTYPVLATIADRIEAISERRRDLTRAIARRG
jgi:DNA repair exonuclease SbcCD ATPase subunit